MLALGVIVFLLVWQVSEPRPLFSDFFKAYYDAAGRVWTHGPVATWPAQESCIEGFVNLPIIAWLFVPLLAFGNPGAGWAFLALSIFGLLWAALHLGRIGHARENAGRSLVLLALLNGPLVNAAREGNSTILTLVLLVLALGFWQLGRELGAGLVLGLAVALKPPLVLLGLFFMFRRRWRIVAGGAAALAAIGLASLAVFGVEMNVGWYRKCISPYASTVIPAFNVQSIDGFLARLASGAGHLVDWTSYELSPLHRLVRVPVLALIYAGVAWAIARCGTPHSTAEPSRLQAGDLRAFSMVLLLAVVTSPISWSHYYLLALLPFGLYVTGALELPDTAATRSLMIGGYALTALPVLEPPLQLTLINEIIARTVVSAWLAGGLLMLAGLVGAGWMESAGVAASSSRVAERSAGFGEPAIAARPAVPLLPLAVFLAASALVLNGAILWLAPTRFEETALHHTLLVLGGSTAEDSWLPMWTALHYFEREYFNPRFTPPIYSEIFFDRGIKFQYPPTALFAMSWMRSLYEAAGDWQVVKAATAMAFLALNVASVAVLLKTKLKLTTSRGELGAVATAILAVCLVLTFYPLVKAFTLGQIQVWINAALAMALTAWALGRKRVSGVLVGIVCLLKPQYGVLFLWAALRREWGFLAAGVILPALAAALSVRVFGWVNHADYLGVIAHLAERGEAFFPNQSINGVLHRIVGLWDPSGHASLEWRDREFPPYHPLIHFGTTAASILILAAALLRPRSRHDHDGALDLARIVLSSTIASPIAWEHHYGILLPIFVLLLASSAESPFRLRWLAISYVLTSNLLLFTNALAATPFNIAQSYLLAGALVALVMLHLPPAGAGRAVPAGEPGLQREAVANG